MRSGGFDGGDLADFRRDGPQGGGIFFRGDRKTEPSDAMTAAVVVVEAESQTAAAREPARILQLRDEKMALAELRANRPTGLWIAVNGKRFGAVVEPAPSPRSLWRKRDSSRRGGGRTWASALSSENSSRMKFNRSHSSAPRPCLGRLGSGKTSNKTAVIPVRSVSASTVMVS